MRKISFCLLCIVLLCGCNSSAGTNSSSSQNSGNTSAANSNNPGSDDDFSFEELKYEPVADCTNVYFKVRNNTGETVDHVTFDCQALDSRGDKLAERTGHGVNDLEPGQAGWTSSIQFYEVPPKDISTVVILGYEVCDRKPGQSNVFENCTYHAYSEKIVYDMDDFQLKK